MAQVSPKFGKLYTAVLCILAAGLPNLNIIMSAGMILLAALWLYEPGIKAGWLAFKENKLAIILAVLFILHILWLWNTSDFAYAFKDIRIKLPLLVMPLVLSGLRLTGAQTKLIWLSLAVGVSIAMLHGFLYSFVDPPVVGEFRDIVRGISHIRFSLMAVLVIASILFYFKSMGFWFRLASIILIGCILCFFNLIQSATGFVVLSLVILFYLGWILRRRKVALIGYLSLLVIVCCTIVFAAKQSYQKYFTVKAQDELLADTTAQGNPYVHIIDAPYVENGNYVFRYLCDQELIEAWNGRSDYTITETGTLKSEPYPTLIRYLTSVGLRKDSSGVNALSSSDVSNIEQGYPSILYVEKHGLALRFHTLLYGYHQYKLSGSASGLSFFQRIVYWRAAIELISKNGLLGTGTGDVKQAFQEIYSTEDFELAPEYRHRAHNQFLTFFVAFGIIGFLYAIMVFIFPFLQIRLGFMEISFLLIAFVSCLSEDTLETQAGVTFFAFFYSLFFASSKHSIDADAT